MPFSFKQCNCSPLVIDNEFTINDETILAEYVAKIVLGHFAHVKRIITSLSTQPITLEDNDIEIAIKRLSSVGKELKDIEKRDGWVFQIISWLSLLTENTEKYFYCQQPHDAPAQHGLDGIAITIAEDLKLRSIIITEDKCTINHRTVIPDIWEEFKLFEKGDYNNKLVNRISALIENVDAGNILAQNQNNITKRELRQYRVTINRNDSYEELKKRRKLFKGYNECVTGDEPHRRFASTIHKNNIRDWMESFVLQVIQFLETQKTANV